MKRWLKRSLALTLGLALALGLLEIALRSMDAFPVQRNPLRGFHRSHPQLGWLGVPDYAARFRRPDFDVLVETGPDGFRLPGHAVTEFEDGAPRIAVLGDSFTWGWGVAQGEVLTDRMQTELGGRARVLNYGTNAYGTGQQRLLLEQVVLPTQPDQVLLMFFANDLDDNVDRKRGKRPWYALEQDRLVLRNSPVERKIAGWTRELSRRSLAISFLHYNFNERMARVKERRRERRVLAAPGASPDESPATGLAQPSGQERWRIFRLLLSEMRQLCDMAPGAPRLRVVYVPERTDLMSKERSIVCEQVTRICELEGVHFLDLTPGLRQAWEEDDRNGPHAWPIYLPHDEHWSADGHVAAARLILDHWSLAAGR